MMKKSKFYYFLAVMLIFSTARISGQANDDFINNVLDRIDTYYMVRPHDNIYVHTDRSVYFAGEEILFRAYVRDAVNQGASTRSDKCILAVMDTKGEEVISHTMDLNGDLLAGSFILPNNLKQGKYNLLGYVVKDGRITAHKIFRKDIIVTNPEEQLMMDYTLDKDLYGSTQEVVMALTAYGFKARKLSKVTLEYDIMINNEVVESGKGKTDKKGRYEIRFRLPESLKGNVVIKVQAEKRKSGQELFIKVPVAKGLKDTAMPLNKTGVNIDISEINDSKLSMSLLYSKSQYKADKKVIIAVLRKGMIYFSAPGQLGQAENITIPVSRIPSGILNVVVFDPEESSVLAERMVYLERENAPHLRLKLNQPSYRNRQEVIAELSIDGNIINIPKETSLSISVVPRDLLPKNDLLLKDHLMVNADILEDGRSELVAVESSPDRKSRIQDFLKESERNGYNWQSVLEQEINEQEISEDEIKQLGEEMRYFPAYFKADRMKDYSQGIMDKRHTNAQKAAYKRQLESGLSVLEAVKTIKPYTMYGNKIIFPGKLNSLYAQQGALIVIDGHPMGQNATVLNSINPTDVESIFVSTEAADVQRYTGLNSVGVVEVNLKGNTDGSKIEDKDSREGSIKEADGDYLKGYPDYSDEFDVRSVILDFRRTLFWNPALVPTEDGKAIFSFYTSDMSGTYVITIQGMLGAHPVSLREEIVVR